LSTQLLWFWTFLQRTDTVPEEDKEKIMQKLQQFDSLLEQNPFVQKKMAESEGKGLAKGEEKGLAKGEEKGLAKGEMKALRSSILRFVQVRFPLLDDLAQQKVLAIAMSDQLNNLFTQLITAQDEQTARALLETAGKQVDG
jgi:flagellar biosynthesis/type III secretory pathway protein FliH